MYNKQQVEASNLNWYTTEIPQAREFSGVKPPISHVKKLKLTGQNYYPMLFKEKSEVVVVLLFRKNLNASKPSEHPPQVEECLKV